MEKDSFLLVFLLFFLSVGAVFLIAFLEPLVGAIFGCFFEFFNFLSCMKQIENKSGE